MSREPEECSNYRELERVRVPLAKNFMPLERRRMEEPESVDGLGTWKGGV